MKVENLAFKNNYQKIFFIIFCVLILRSTFFIYKKVFVNNIKIQLSDIYQKENVVPVVILGSGPAGLSAGIYASRLGFKTLIIEGNKPGGQLMSTTYVENWPGEIKILGKDLIEKLREHDRALGVSFLPENVANIDLSKWPYQIVTADNIKINALSLIIATGSSPRTLNIPGEQQYWGKGVTTCAICDAPFFKGKKVIVVGGGDSAAEQVLQLSPYASHITMIVRKDSLRASQAMQNRVNELPNLTISYNKELRKISGDNEHVNAVEIFDNKNNSSNTSKIDGVFLAIGHEPNTTLFKNKINMDKAGYILLKDRSQKTSLPGVFAAGDVEDYTYMQAGIASGEGIKAALDASAFLHHIGFNSDVASKIKERYFDVKEQTGPSQVVQITSYQELEKLLKSKKPVIIDFWAKHCPTCIHMLPSFDSLSKKYSDNITFVKVDTDKAKELSEKLFVIKVPTFIVFKNGQIAGRYHDFMDKTQMTEFVEKFVN